MDENRVTMHYEDDGDKKRYWVVLTEGKGGKILFKFPYENMRHYADLYRMRDDAREYILFWAKMIVDPD
jgi:hypothetical protein